MKLSIIGLLAWTAFLSPRQDDDPRCKDKTGMAWVHPFPEAQAKAKKAGRMLMIKPIAFGTTPDGGW